MRCDRFVEERRLVEALYVSGVRNFFGLTTISYEPMITAGADCRMSFLGRSRTLALEQVDPKLLGFHCLLPCL